MKINLEDKLIDSCSNTELKQLIKELTGNYYTPGHKYKTHQVIKEMRFRRLNIILSEFDDAHYKIFDPGHDAYVTSGDRESVEIYMEKTNAVFCGFTIDDYEIGNFEITLHLLTQSGIDTATEIQEEKDAVMKLLTENQI